MHTWAIINRCVHATRLQRFDRSRRRFFSTTRGSRVIAQTLALLATNYKTLHFEVKFLKQFRIAKRNPVVKKNMLANVHVEVGDAGCHASAAGCFAVGFGKKN